MNVLKPYRDDLKALIAATLPEITAPIFRISQLQQRNLQYEQLEKRLQPPWGAYDVSLTPTQEWGAANVVWQAQTTFYYFATGAGKNDGTPVQDIAAFCEDQLFLLSDALLSGAFAYTILPDAVPTPNAAADNPASRPLIEMNIPSLMGGSLVWTALIGYNPD